jgi:hypothetical protein
MVHVLGTAAEISCQITSSFLILEPGQYSNHVFGGWSRSFARRFTAYNIRSNRNGNGSAGTREILPNQMGPSEEIDYYSSTCAGGRNRSNVR